MFLLLCVSVKCCKEDTGHRCYGPIAQISSLKPLLSFFCLQLSLCRNFVCSLVQNIVKSLMNNWPFMASFFLTQICLLVVNHLLLHSTVYILKVLVHNNGSIKNMKVVQTHPPLQVKGLHN